MLIYPLFAMFLLSASVLVKTFLTRLKAVRSGEIRFSYFKTLQGENIPEEVLKASRHFTNLFEAPVLFYVVCLLAIFYAFNPPLFVGMAWLYVALRAVHAYIHIGYNNILHRMRVYFASWVVLTCMWVNLVWQVTVN